MDNYTLVVSGFSGDASKYITLLLYMYQLSKSPIEIYPIIYSKTSIPMAQPCHSINWSVHEISDQQAAKAQSLRYSHTQKVSQHGRLLVAFAISSNSL